MRKSAPPFMSMLSAAVLVGCSSLEHSDLDGRGKISGQAESTNETSAAPRPAPDPSIPPALPADSTAVSVPNSGTASSIAEQPKPDDDPSPSRPSTTPPVSWSPRFQGVEIGSFTLQSPRLMRGTAVRIDLQAPGLSIVTTPSNGDRPGETDGTKTSTFLRAQQCQVAINAAPFSPIHLLEGQQQDISGFHVSDGEIVSPPGGPQPALLITSSQRAEVAPPPFPQTGIANAVGGFGIVLEQGNVVGREAPLHPRTAAGVSKDGRILYLLVIDGRQRGYSEGASTADVGRLLSSLGAWDGINLDGGGTTTLVTEDSSGEPEVLNRPINGGIPGFERVSASHLGVRAKPL